MKRLMAAILAALMLLPLCGCGPDIEECLHNAESYIEGQDRQLREEGNYRYWWEYDGAGEYSIVMMVDPDDLDDIYDSIGGALGEDFSSYTEGMVKVYLKKLDDQTEFIEVNLSVMKSSVEMLLEETDINVSVYYMNIDGEITISG